MSQPTTAVDSPTVQDEVEAKLRYELLPYFVTANRLKKWRPLQIYTFYLYSGEIFVLLAGFGLSNPIINFLAGGDPVKSSETSKSASIIEFLGSGYAAILAIVLLLVWGVLKFYVRKEELEKRCNLLRSCILQCSQSMNRVRGAIANNDPMPVLLDIQQKTIDLVDRNIIERAWPYDGPEEGIQPIVNRICDDLIMPFKARWKGSADRR